MSDQTPDLAALEALAEAATPTDWHAATPADDCPERTAAEYLAKTCANPDRHPKHLHAVWVPELSEGDGKPNLIIAFTGDGPTSQANAAYIAAAHPGTVLWLIREVKRLTRWQAEAMTVMDGLQELGVALGLPIGARITGPDAVEAATTLRAERDSACCQRDAMGDERDALAARIAKVEALVVRVETRMMATAKPEEIREALREGE